MAKQTISIIGAGLGGLTLGRCLQKRGIAAILYERLDSPPRYSYGITLHASAYTPLLKALDVDEMDFKSRVAVDASSGGRGGSWKSG
jgi:2-polyprenyl-6-methoxyphenol hydroxylase-like FAD-dependent oxidoreductase